MSPGEREDLGRIADALERIETYLSIIADEAEKEGERREDESLFLGRQG